MQVGAALFAEHCTECHGEGGAGDGELAQSGQVTNVGNFTDPQTARDQRPRAWFDTITNGRLENLMPPWHDALREEERWAVAYYTYTLHYDPAQIEQGAVLYEQHCVECHGESGRGDGERAAQLGGDVGNLTHLENMSLVSDTVLYNVVTEGIGDPLDGMPAFMDDLTEGERLAVATYVRTLGLAKPEFIGTARIGEIVQAEATPEATAEVTAEASAITLSGQIINGSALGAVPADQTVTLFIFAPQAAPQQFTTTANDAGAFTFADVPLIPDATYVATTGYRDRVFVGEPVSGAELGANPLNVTIYELTEDQSVISFDGVVTQVNVTPDGLEVAQVFSVTNSSDRAYTTSRTTPDGRPIGLIISLPPGAVVPAFNESGRYVYAPEAFALLDTAPVLPGEGHLIQVVYLINYEGSAIIEQPLNYPLEGIARLLVSPTTVRVSSAQFPSLGTEVVGNTQVAAYGGDMSLAAGDVLRYELTGSGGESAFTTEVTPVVTSNEFPVVIVIIIVLEVALVVGLIAWFRRRRARRQS
jgi:mono/diheme cytochrome c family protein